MPGVTLHFALGNVFVHSPSTLQQIYFDDHLAAHLSLKYVYDCMHVIIMLVGSQGSLYSTAGIKNASSPPPPEDLVLH